jgi:hypothetical protein
MGSAMAERECNNDARRFLLADLSPRSSLTVRLLEPGQRLCVDNDVD